MAIFCKGRHKVTDYATHSYLSPHQTNFSVEPLIPSGRLTLNTFEIQSYFLLFVATIMLKNLVKA